MMTQLKINITIQVDGELTDADAPPHVTVRRDDTGAIVVDDAQMTRVSLGAYSNAFTGADGVSYTGTVTGTVAGDAFSLTKAAEADVVVTGMSLGTAIAITRAAARNAGDTGTYSDDAVCIAIDGAASEFCRRTKYLRALAAIAIAAGATSVAAPSDFRADHFLGASVDGVPCEILSFEQMEADRAVDGFAGKVRALSFPTNATIYLFPTAKTDGTLMLRYARPWPGAASSIPLPDDIMRQVCQYGASVYLQQSMKEQNFTGPAYQKFLALIQELSGSAPGPQKTVMKSLSRRSILYPA